MQILTYSITLFQVNRPTVIAVYFNVTVVQNSSALLTNFTSSIIYSNMVGANRTVPTNLKSFGKEMVSTYRI